MKVKPRDPYAIRESIRMAHFVGRAFPVHEPDPALEQKLLRALSRERAERLQAYLESVSAAAIEAAAGPSTAGATA